MPARASRTAKGPTALSSSTPNAASCSRPATTTPARLPELPVPPNPPPRRMYPEYINGHSGAHGWDAAVTIGSMLEHIPTLPLSIAGPLRQVVDVASGIVRTIEDMRQNRDDCAHLINRVLKFLQSLVDDLRMTKVPILDGTPTAARLFALKRLVLHCHCISSSLRSISFGGSNLMSIQEDTERWSRLGVLGAYMKSAEIKVAISRHTDNLMDCFSTFQVWGILWTERMRVHTLVHQYS
ncbi:hypothetical protein BS47DRAFT_745667 [Hydnum rufescens UP504]|uniref:Uncharacterized protein n=1 Tax=Hydnum rufescens UP504 TaxID=1448309 RepID=A0A9P6B3R8_9AGAM|nr:hypothetical protein BS47DRAFT_745667 [Hydnum rufescens UP504]